jgi:hypothetical protein
MSDCSKCISWQVRHQIKHIEELEKEIDSLASEKTYLLCAEVKVKLNEAKRMVRKLKT